MTDPVQLVHGSTAREIAASLEAAIRQGNLSPGAGLPSVRQLATRLGVSPPTVSAALADLRRRGVVVTQERRRSVVSPRPPVSLGFAEPRFPEHVRDLARGNPDPALLPDTAPFLKRLADTHQSNLHLYGDEPVDPRLLELGRQELAEAGVAAEQVCIVSGALDGVERVLGAHLAPGDRVIVEDPGYFAVFDLLRAMNLEPIPVAVDEFGMRPDALSEVIDRAQALIITPRAHNPTGAALHRLQAAALRGVLACVPRLLVIEDDHQGPISGAAGVTTTQQREHWAVVRSVAKSLGPDLRLAFVGGDAETIARVEGRLALGPGWVSHYLQDLVYELLSSDEVRQLLARAQATYTRRRRALLAALNNRGIVATGRSGFNVWVDVDDEAATVNRLLRSGWAVAPGARYRLRTPPAIRITCATLPEDLADSLAADLAQASLPARRGRTG